MASLPFPPSPFLSPESPSTFPSLLKSCPISLGRQLHAHLIKLRAGDLYSHTALLHLYSKSGSLGDALKVFDRMPQRTLPTWNSMISGLARNGLVEEALEMMSSMESSDLGVGLSTWNSAIAGCILLGDVGLTFALLAAMPAKPNSTTFNTLLPVIPLVPDLDALSEFHAFALRNVSAIDTVSEDRLWSAIATAYVNHGAVECASRLFERVRLKNSQLGNSMISGFLTHRRTEDAFRIFRGMAAECIREAMILSRVSLTLLLPECHRESRAGAEIHAYAVRRGLDSDTSVGNALVAMYSRRGDRESADEVFTRILEKDIVSWNAVFASHATARDYDSAFDTFQRMLANGVKPDEFSFSSVLHGCGHSSRLHQGMALHAHMLKSGLLHSYLVVENSLMDAYGKCGCVEDARKVFDEMDFRDTISWNTIISCYGFSAVPNEAVLLFETMRATGPQPNRVTFVALLSACSHAGYLEKGLHYFESMANEHGIVPDTDHYTCIVDNMGRAGQLERAYQFVKDMPIEPDDCVWSALLSGCRIHGNVELAAIAARNLVELEPGHSGYWVLLSNVYADASRWRDMSDVRTTMKEVGVKKIPGYSWIEVGVGEVHRFLTADKVHERCNDIYFVIDRLNSHLKDEGYIQIFNSIDPRSTSARYE